MFRRTLYTPIGPTSPVPLGYRRHPRVQRRRVSLYTVIVRYANCCGGHADGRALQAWAVTDPPFPSMYTTSYPAWRRPRLCSLGAIGARVAGHTQSPRFIAAATRPLTSSHPYPPTCRPAHLSDDAALACRVARLPPPSTHASMSGCPRSRRRCIEEMLLFPICDSAPRGVREIRAKSALGAAGEGVFSPPMACFTPGAPRRRTAAGRGNLRRSSSLSI